VELFAETAPPTSDETFVSRVSDRISRRRRLQTAARLGLAAALVLSAGVAGPHLIDGVAYLAQLPGLAARPVATFLVTPAGWALSALAATLVVIRAAGSAAGSRRRTR